MSTRKIILLVAALVGAGILAGVALTGSGDVDKSIPAQPRNMTFRWDAPTSGTTPVRYDVEIRIGGNESDNIETRTVTTNEVTFEVDWVTIYEVRVRAVDAAGRVGPWSKWSLAEDRDLDDPEDVAG